MTKLKIGWIKFRILNNDTIFRYENTNFTWTFSALFIFPFTGGIAVLTARLYEPLFDNFTLTTIYISFVILLFVYIVMFTRLFKRKVIINRKDQTISSAMLFSLGRRDASFPQMVTRRVHIRGTDTIQCFLCEEKVKEKSLNIYYKDYIQFFEADEHFLTDLKAYMNYTSHGKQLDNQQKTRIPKNDRVLRLQENIRKYEWIKNKSAKQKFLLAKYYKDLAAIYEHDGNMEKALFSLEKALVHAEQIKNINLNFNCDLLSKSGLLYYKQGLSEKALDKFQKAFDSFGDSLDQHAVSVCYTKLGNLSEAVKNLDELYREWEDPNCLFFIAELLLVDGKKIEAVERLKIAQQEMMNNDDKDCHKVELYLNNFDKQIITLSDIIERESSVLLENYD
jgi:tetratricopeptide (TPR) repeat protein